MRTHGSTVTERRRFSLHLSRVSCNIRWPLTLQRVMDRRANAMSEHGLTNMCFTCFGIIEEVNSRQPCCDRHVCIECIAFMASTFVQNRQISGANISYPRCPSCGYSGTTRNLRMVMIPNHNFENVSGVVMGNANIFSLNGTYSQFHITAIRTYWQSVSVLMPEILVNNSSLITFLAEGNTSP